MKKLPIIIGVMAVLFGAWWIFRKQKTNIGETKQQPLKVGTHSNEFNKSFSNVITTYINLKDAFVNADTVLIKSNQKKFIASIDRIKIDDLKKDTSGVYQSAQAQLGDIKSNAEAILKETDITEMRQDFRMVSENLFPLLKIIHYEGDKLYWQNCPMAFGEGKDASWISNEKEINNPYLGKNHPEFKGTMLHCGEIKDTIQ